MQKRHKVDTFLLAVFFCAQFNLNSMEYSKKYRPQFILCSNVAVFNHPFETWYLLRAIRNLNTVYLITSKFVYFNDNNIVFYSVEGKHKTCPAAIIRRYIFIRVATVNVSICIPPRMK